MTTMRYCSHYESYYESYSIQRVVIEDRMIKQKKKEEEERKILEEKSSVKVQVNLITSGLFPV